MTPEDNLEKYFKHVLNEASPLSEQEWSIPSDDLWEAAKIHFPKKKKRDRAIFFWFSLGVFCLLIGTGVASYMSQKTTAETAKIITKNAVRNESNQTSQQIKQVTIPTTIEKINATAQNELKTKKANKQIEINSSINPQNTTNRVKKRLTKTKTNLNNLTSVEPVKSENQLKTNPNEIKKESLDIATSLDKPTPSAKIAILSPLKKTIPFLNIVNRILNLKDTLQTLTVPVTRTFKQWEVGVSYAPFVLIQESILNEGATSNFASQTIGIKHQNINLSVRRYLHPRFSISSGLYLSKGAIDIALCDKGVYENNNIATLRYFIGESDATNKINLSDIGLDFDASFEYLEDAKLKPGDELTLKGNIPFKLKFVQIPVLFNIHFGKRKFNGLVHTGISLDYLSVKAGDPKWGIFKETELISKPIDVDPLNEQTLKVRLQAGIGLRYAIKDFLQLGTGININISAPFLSRYDFGIYYGF